MPAITLRTVAVAAILLGWWGRHDLPAQAQQPPPVFRTSTRLIIETVTVVDRDGKPVEGLTPADFTVTEDGVPQDIAFVEYQRVEAGPVAGAPLLSTAAPASSPMRAAAEPAVAPAVEPQISAPGGVQYRNRRLVVLYFDMSAMPPPDQMRAFSNAQVFVDSGMEPQDLVAIMTFQGGAVRVKQDFTADRAALTEAVQRLIFGDDLDGDGVPDTAETGTAFGQGDAEFNVFNTDRQLSALQTAVTMLRPLPEQKALVYFGSGLRLNGSNNQAQLRATINAALRANVSINPIDARGLVADAPLGDATRRSPGGIGMFTGQQAMSRSTNFQRSQDTLFALAKDTGGKAMFDYNDLALGIAQAADTIGNYYIVAYYSSHTAADGKFRRVRVTVRSDRAANVSHRAGDFADKEFGRFSAAEKERQLEEALMLENPVTDITIALEVNYFQLSSAEYFVPVAVKIPGSELTLARRRGAARTEIDFIGEVKDDFGITMQNVRDRLDIPLSDDTASQMASRPIQYETGFTLLPGNYVIKFLARDATTGRIGTYQAAFTVPNLNRETVRVPTSSVVLGSQLVPLGEALHTVRQKVDAEAANPLVFNGQKLIPSVTRVFSASRDLQVFLQAYQRDTAEQRPLASYVTLIRDGVPVFESEPLAVTGGRDRRGAIPLRFSLPLAGLAPGDYEVQVAVLDPAAGKVAFWRASVALIP